MRASIVGRATLAVVASVGLVVCGCGDSDADGGRAGTAGTAGAAADGVDGSILVFAAASLTESFGEIEAAFEDANPDADVRLNLAGSSALREHILDGAPADVFASANLSNMDQVVAAGAVAGEPEILALNELRIAVPAGNPATITGLDDFDDADLLLGLCAEGVPCGDFAREALASAGVTPALDTDEPDVRSLLTKIEAGELDAGIVYVSDVASGGHAVEGVEIPAEHNVVAEYPIARLVEAPNPHGATAFVEFVSSPAGRTVLERHGFSTP